MQLWHYNNFLYSLLTVVPVILLALLIVVSGYFLIYNVFSISITMKEPIRSVTVVNRKVNAATTTAFAPLKYMEKDVAIFLSIMFFPYQLQWMWNGLA